MTPTLLLLPGLDGTGDLFAPFVAALPNDLARHVVRYPVDQTWGYDALLTHIEAHLPAGPLVVLGESFSGPLALRLAARHPERIRGLVLCCTFARFPWSIARRLGAWAGNLPIETLARWGVKALLLDRAAPDGSARAMLAAIAKVAPAVLRQRTAAVLGVDATPALDGLKLPVLDLRAGQDRLVPARARQVLASALPQLRPVTLNGPHALLQARPAEAATQVHQFVCALVTAAPALPPASPPAAPVHRA